MNRDPLDGPGSESESESGAESESWMGKLKGALESARESGENAGESTGRAAGRAHAIVTSRRAKLLAAGVLAVVVAVGAFWWVATSRGLFDAVVYSFLFVFCLTFFPVFINLLGGGTPTSIGKLHLLLGAVAFDHHYLVQREHGWQWCPGDRGRVYIDGEWHDVDGEENYSVLGWRPFGILRYKDEKTWADKRVDQAGLKARGSFDRERDPTTDGGVTVAERGGFKEVERPNITGLDGTWLLDLKRVFTNGVRKIGDVELIETAEEVIERSQVEDGKLSNAGPLAESIAGFILGVLAGFGYILISG